MERYRSSTSLPVLQHNSKGRDLPSSPSSSLSLLRLPSPSLSLANEKDLKEWNQTSCTGVDLSLFFWFLVLLPQTQGRAGAPSP